MTPEQRTAYYRWEFRKWHQTKYPGCPGCLGSASIKTLMRAEWVCSWCGRDVSLQTVLISRL